MRAALLLAAALLASAFALPVDAAGPVGPTLFGPTNIPAARNWSYSGQLVVEATGSPVLLYGQTVGLWLDGVRVAEAETDAQGKYLAQVTFPVGLHTLEARAFEGTPLEEPGPALAVRAFPTWPAGPSHIRGDPGFHYTQANVSWRYPWTDGGYPVTSYRIERSANGGPFQTVFTGLAYQFVDTNVTPGFSYIYEGYSTTAWGTSNKTSGGYTANNTVATVQLVEYRVCDGPVCLIIPDGGSFSTSAGTNVMVTAANVTGIVDVHPVSPPGLPDRTVYGEIRFPNMSKQFQTTSGAAGAWSFALGTFFAQAPASGCASVSVVAYARPANQGRSEDVGGFDLCV